MNSAIAPYYPVAVFFLLVAGTAAAMLGVAHLLGPRRRHKLKLSSYECGMPLLKGSRERFSVKFYLVAILFVLFDIETVFLLPWAVKLRSLGVFGLVEMLVFMSVLVIGLVYAWRRGGLEWD